MYQSQKGRKIEWYRMIRTCLLFVPEHSMHYAIIKQNNVQLILVLCDIDYNNHFYQFYPYQLQYNNYAYILTCYKELRLCLFVLEYWVGTIQKCSPECLLWLIFQWDDYH